MIWSALFRFLPSLPLAALLLAGCENHYRLPEGYTGPTAVIRSSSSRYNAVKGERFVVSEIDGKAVRQQPAQPYGGGPVLALQDTEVTVPVQPLALTLSGGTVYGSDGIALVDMASGGSRQVSGKLSFTPRAGGRYQVRGTLEKGRESIWLADEKTGKAINP